MEARTEEEREKAMSKYRIEVYATKGGNLSFRRVSRNGRIVGSGESNGYSTPAMLLKGIGVCNWGDAPIVAVSPSPSRTAAVRSIIVFQRHCVRKEIECGVKPFRGRK